MPFVTFGRPWGAPDTHSWVDVDNAAGTAMATRHLLDAGHRRIGFLGWPAGSGVGDARRDGWQNVFYVDAARFADYASVGALEPYADKISNLDDFYPNLRQAFTFGGKVYCVPKDTSTLALQINTALWRKAGLTDADVPTNWDQLTAAAQKIKAKGGVALAIGDARDRIGAFLVQNGGW